LENRIGTAAEEQRAAEEQHPKRGRGARPEQAAWRRGRRGGRRLGRHAK
jgi:hypothetical protein